MRLATGLLAAALLGGCSGGGPPERLQGVVLIVLDTLRADHLGCYGYERPTSPEIDALARDGVRFAQAVSPAPWTLPSVSSLLAGRYAERVWREGRLSASVVETLREAGVTTAAFTEGGFFSRAFAHDRGFGHFVEEEGPVQLEDAGRRRDRSKQGGIARTFAAAEAWLGERGEERFFLLVHTYEPHAPYTNRDFARELPPGRLGPVFGLDEVDRVATRMPALTAGEIEYVVALYDGDVRNSDRHVGSLLRRLEALDLAERVAVIVTSDHGEEFADHYPRNTASHGHSLRDPLVLVPLVIRDPSLRDRVPVVESQVRLIDVMPTVADLLDVEPGGELDGRSLRPLMRGAEEGDRLALSGQTGTGPWRMGLRWRGQKYIRSVPVETKFEPMTPTPPGRQLYDLAADPGERDNLAPKRPKLVEELDRVLQERHPGFDALITPDVANEVDPELAERLESLGYLR